MKSLTYFKTYETTLLSLVPCERGDFENELKEVQDCIAELEAQQKRSCESCTHLLHKLEYQSPFCLEHNYRLTHENKKVLSCNRYEAKDAQ